MRLSGRACQFIERDVSGEFKKGKYVLTGDVRICGEKLLNRFASFKEVEQSLNGYASASEARHAVHDLFVDRDDLG
jgi:hypothetical protein